ncbi:uncharacterized protein EDB91DRAFT_1122323 [Suillus paluster]|uniref:uncharacterized protein n=1 Tax=Suillus paluster TaxID=48578 RepID=UPI001B86C850|nr:uncharacterized protein EDB91DRAFT_1122323 [Suillus paluster]KAG1745078.1 hypothetical protein EDB91DRAFT_1122323 [Suillus paluster]
MGVTCSPAKQHLFIERLMACIDSSMSHRLRHAALRAAHSAREVFASIDAIDNAMLRDMVFTKFSPAILTAVCPRPGATPTKHSPDLRFDSARELCYLQLVFSLARNTNWRSHLSRDGHIKRCISMIAECCESSGSEHAFYLAGIFLRIASEQASVTPLASITEQQWWEVIRWAWDSAYRTTGDMHCFEFLPVLVEGTKKHIEIAPKSDVEQLIKHANRLLAWRSKQREDVAVVVRDLMAVAYERLEKLETLERSGQ